MHILSMTNGELFDDPSVMYVGRTNYVLGLGNPWGYKGQMRQARFATTSKKEAVDKYREWMLNYLIPHYISGFGLLGLESWEKEYLARVVHLALAIKKGTYRALGCWCVNIENYTPVSDGLEKCHAEILYKACLQIIEYRESKK